MLNVISVQAKITHQSNKFRKYNYSIIRQRWITCSAIFGPKILWAKDWKFLVTTYKPGRISFFNNHKTRQSSPSVTTSGKRQRMKKYCNHCQFIFERNRSLEIIFVKCEKGSKVTIFSLCLSTPISSLLLLLRFFEQFSSLPCRKMLIFLYPIKRKKKTVYRNLKRLSNFSDKKLFQGKQKTQ